MIVAAYARFSSDQQRDTSIHDQFRNCARYASDHGWSITYFHEDKAVSGAHSDRTGYQTMLRDAQAKQFEILLVDDLSRLSRDEAECIQLRRRLHFWGIRLIGVSDGYDSTAKGHKLQASLRGLMNELYLDDLRDKTHRGLMGQALKGYSCGGRAYGYTRVPLYDDTKHDAYGRPQISAVRWIPDPEQAQWVRWIFERYAAGTSPRELAADLNRQQVPSPRGGTWSASAIRGNLSDGTGILCNSLYVGRYVWNRSRWERHFETKRRVRRLRDRQEWIEVSTPELAIVSQALWDQVQARIQTQANPAIAHACRQTAGRPGRYLFSELLKCGQCGANYIVADRYRYACASYLNRGEAVCANRCRVARRVLEDTLLRGIQDDLFTEEGFVYFKQEVRRALETRRKARRTDVEHAQADVRRVETELSHLLTAIKAGIVTATTKAELERLERERARLGVRQGIQRESDGLARLLPRALERFQHAVDNLARVPADHIAEARRALLLLLGGKPILLHPRTDGSLEAELAGDYAGLVRMVTGEELNNRGCGGRI